MQWRVKSCENENKLQYVVPFVKKVVTLQAKPAMMIHKFFHPRIIASS